MVTNEELNKAWEKYYSYRNDILGGPSNGCDDYGDFPLENINKLKVLEDTSRKLQKEYNESQHYVDNDVFRYRVSLKSDFIDENITVYTKPFSDFPSSEYQSEEQIYNYVDKQENLVQERYFTQQKIDELKLKFIQQIQECKNPFNIYCVDRDSGYNVTEDQLFNLD